ncbi:hypothetical protein QU801_22735, partial [Escherichia coli]|nr:hypothetical protein [Escherichia coli]
MYRSGELALLLVVINVTIQSLPYLLLKREMMAKKMPRRSGLAHSTGSPVECASPRMPASTASTIKLS